MAKSKSFLMVECNRKALDIRLRRVTSLRSSDGGDWLPMTRLRSVVKGEDSRASIWFEQVLEEDYFDDTYGEWARFFDAAKGACFACT
jgi:hypothetical protein